jgi:predicted small metal-binding protein
MMKTMTCRQLGGPCDLALRGASADEVIKLQDKHLRSVVADGDESHKDALAQMKGRWKHPIKGMGWYRDVKRDFAALHND